jgi:AraC-like DNA-binding protein
MLVATKPEQLSGLSPRQVRKARRFFLDSASSSDLPLTVVSGGHEYCSPAYGVSIERRSRITQWSSSPGARLNRLGRAATASSPPAASSHTDPAFPHRITSDARDPLEKYFVGLAGPRAPQLLQDCGLAPGTVSRVSSVGEVQEVFENLIRDGLRGTETSNTLCTVLSEYLLVKLADLVVPAGEHASSASVTFQRCRQHIATHFRRLRSLEEVAEECDINEAYLCRLFRRFDHEGPYRYLLRLKMNFAAEKLRDPKVLVKEAAAVVGFRDPFQFSHTFKNIFGSSPDVFRRLREQQQSVVSNLA